MRLPTSSFAQSQPKAFVSLSHSGAWKCCKCCLHYEGDGHSGYSGAGHADNKRRTLGYHERCVDCKWTCCGAPGNQEFCSRETEDAPGAVSPAPAPATTDTPGTNSFTWVHDAPGKTYNGMEVFQAHLDDKLFRLEDHGNGHGTLVHVEGGYVLPIRARPAIAMCRDAGAVAAPARPAAFSFGSPPAPAFGHPSATFGAGGGATGFNFNARPAPARPTAFGFGAHAAPAFGPAPARPPAFGFGGSAAPTFGCPGVPFGAGGARGSFPCLKVRFGSDVRRVSPDRLYRMTFAQLVELTDQAFTNAGPTLFKYIDDEGELVTIAGDHDLAEAVRIIAASGQRILTIEVGLKAGEEEGFGLWQCMRRAREEHETKKKLDVAARKAKPATPQVGFDHPSAVENFSKLTDLIEGKGPSGCLTISSIWRRGNKYRKATELKLPFPFEMRRDERSGELWIKVSGQDGYQTSRLGLGEPLRNAATGFNQSWWARLYGINVGEKRDEEIITASTDSSAGR